jgi:CRP-like cAMP-binding protein
MPRIGEGSWLDLPGVDTSTERALDTGEVVFRQGAEASSLYRVRTGRIRLIRHLQDGSSVALHVARADSTFAEAALFSDTYHCDAVAEMPSVVAVIPKADLLAGLCTTPSGCLDLARALAGQVRELRAHLEMRNIRSAPERLLAWFRLKAKGNPPVVEIDRPWIEVAAEIGLTHETIYRSLAELERAGKLSREGRRIELKGPA